MEYYRKEVLSRGDRRGNGFIASGGAFANLLVHFCNNADLRRLDQPAQEVIDQNSSADPRGDWGKFSYFLDPNRPRPALCPTYSAGDAGRCRNFHSLSPSS